MIITASIWLAVVLEGEKVKQDLRTVEPSLVLPACCFALGNCNGWRSLIKEFDPCDGERIASRRTYVLGGLRANQRAEAGVEKKSQMGISCTRKHRKTPNPRRGEREPCLGEQHSPPLAVAAVCFSIGGSCCLYLLILHASFQTASDSH